MVKLSGDAQPGKAGELLAAPFAVRLTDGAGEGSGGIPVTWSVTQGEGVLDGQFQRCPAGDLSDVPAQSRTVLTDRQGVARVSFMPTVFGPVAVQAAPHYLWGQPVTFYTDASDAGARLEIVSGDGQQGVAQAGSFADPLVVRVRNGAGAAVSHIPVTWSVEPGVGRLWSRYDCFAPITHTALARTAADDNPYGIGLGASAVDLQLLVTGVTTITAEVPGLQGSPVSFTIESTRLVIGYGFNYWFETWNFYGPDGSPDVRVPLGTPVEFLNWGPGTATIVSTAAPAGGTSFERQLEEGARAVFIPDVSGTWEFAEETTGARGSITVQ